MHLRCIKRAVGCAVSLLGMAVAPLAAEAPATGHGTTMPAPPSPRSLSRARVYGFAFRSRYSELVRDEPESPPERYRTLCVRLCDGYYWPVSESVSRGRFYRDAETCAASCDQEAQMFYQPIGDRSPSAMIDLSGRRYADLDEAFAYRKKMVSGCTCRPEPWTAAEIARHQSYVVPETEAEPELADEPHRTPLRMTREATVGSETPNAEPPITRPARTARVMGRVSRRVAASPGRGRGVFAW